MKSANMNTTARENPNGLVPRKDANQKVVLVVYVVMVKMDVMD
jgi:hypothetical protein